MKKQSEDTDTATRNEEAAGCRHRCHISGCDVVKEIEYIAGKERERDQLKTETETGWLPSDALTYLFSSARPCHA
jgi:hypothetical protein